MGRIKHENCAYPNCTECKKEDCDMEQNDIAALLKRRRYQNELEKHRELQRNYRQKVKDNLPHCNECENCILVLKDKGDGFRRLCISEMRLIEQKVSNSPQWCKKRTPSEDYLKRRNDILKQKKEKYRERNIG